MVARHVYIATNCPSQYVILIQCALTSYLFTTATKNCHLPVVRNNVCVLDD
jgi:hypothetical protein